MPTHLPAFQFYPGDWRKSVEIQMLDYFDRGVWFELLCFMHEAEERGSLKVNGVWLDDETISRLLGIGSSAWKQTRSNLEAAGVPGIDEETGGIYSRRMVRDEAIRLAKVEAGRLGGMKSRPPPAPKQTRSKPKADPRTTPEAKRGSSVSSSSSKKKNTKRRKEAETPQTQPKRPPAQPTRASQIRTVKKLLQEPDDLPDSEPTA